MILYGRSDTRQAREMFNRALRFATIAFCLALSTVLPANAKTLLTPSISVDGTKLSARAIERNNMIFVPVHGVFEKLGTVVSYSAPSAIMARKNGSDLVRMAVGSRSAVVRGTTQTLDIAPFAVGGHVMIPLRLVGEAAGATVAYVASPRSVQLTPRTVVAQAASTNDAAAVPAAAEPSQGLAWWIWTLLALAVLALIVFLLTRRRKEPVIRTSGAVRTDPTIETRR